MTRAIPDPRGLLEFLMPRARAFATEVMRLVRAGEGERYGLRASDGVIVSFIAVQHDETGMPISTAFATGLGSKDDLVTLVRDWLAINDEAAGDAHSRVH